MITKDKFISDVTKVIHEIDIMESNKTIAVESWEVIDDKLQNILKDVKLNSYVFKESGVDDE